MGFSECLPCLWCFLFWTFLQCISKLDIFHWHLETPFFVRFYDDRSWESLPLQTHSGHPGGLESRSVALETSGVGLWPLRGSLESTGCTEVAGGLGRWVQKSDTEWLSGILLLGKWPFLWFFVGDRGIWNVRWWKKKGCRKARCMNCDAH